MVADMYAAPVKIAQLLRERRDRLHQARYGIVSVGQSEIRLARRICGAANQEDRHAMTQRYQENSGGGRTS